MSGKKKPKGWRFGSAPYELRLGETDALSTLERAGKRVDVTDLEKELLIVILSNCRQVVTKQQLIDAGWKGDPTDDNTVGVAMARLKKKVPDLDIETVRTVGQRLICWVEPLGGTDELRVHYLISLFTDADVERQTIQDAEWDRKYAPYIDEVRRGLAWAMAEAGRRFYAINLFGATGRVFERLSLLPESRGNVDRILPLIDKDIPDASAARFFLYAGLLWREADRHRALSLFQQSAAFYRKLEDSDNLATVLGKIGGTRVYLGQHDQAESDLKESIKQLLKTDRKKDLANAFNDLGLLLSMKNRPSDAKECFDDAIDIADSYNDTLRKYIVVMNLGEMEYNGGAPDRAQLRYEEANQGLVSAPNAYRLRPKVNLAMCYAVQGNYREARSRALEAWSLCAEGDGTWRLLIALVLAFLAACHGEPAYAAPAYAAQLLGAIKQLVADSGTLLQKLEQDLCDQLMKLLQEKLSADSLGVWLLEGGRWTEARAMTYIESHILPAIPAETTDDQST
jgi:tetratricopeptide (TPR) repeat protein